MNPKKKAKNVAGADIFLAIEAWVEVAGVQATVEIYHIGDAIEASMPDPADQLFQHCDSWRCRLGERLTRDQLVGSTIMLAYEPFQQPYER